MDWLAYFLSKKHGGGDAPQGGMTSVVYNKGAEYETVEIEGETYALVSELTPSPEELEGALFGIIAPTASFYWWEFLKVTYGFEPIENAIYIAAAELDAACSIVNQNNEHYAVSIFYKKAAEYGLPYKPGIYMNTKYVDEETWKMALCW